MSNDERITYDEVGDRLRELVGAGVLRVAGINKRGETLYAKVEGLSDEEVERRMELAGRVADMTRNSNRHERRQRQSTRPRRPV